MERFLTSKSLIEIMFNILDICIISRSLSLYNIAFFRGITLKGCCVLKGKNPLSRKSTCSLLLGKGEKLSFFLRTRLCHVKFS